MKLSLKIPPHLKRVATLPCQSKCQETRDNLKTNILFNNKFNVLQLNLIT